MRVSRITRQILAAVLLSGCLWAETCSEASDMDEATRNALLTTARHYFDLAAKGDAATLKQNAIPSLAADFSAIETAVKDNQARFAAAPPAPRPPYLLKVEGNAPVERAEFLCGVFTATGQTAASAVFVIPNLPPGNYGVVIFEVSASDGLYTPSFVLQQSGTEWKLGGFYAKPAQATGHDGKWFADKAREFKAKGQMHNAWFYYLQARDLMVPLPFMSTRATDQLYDEFQNAAPKDLPLKEPADLSAAGKTFKIVRMFPLADGNNLDLVVKYQSADISNTKQTYDDNMSLIKALVMKYPELREGFAAIVARAVTPSGTDYGSLLAMKDIK